MFYLFHLFRSFLPLQNPIGFGAADFVELALVVALVALTIGWHRGIKSFAAWLAPRTAWCMIGLALLPVLLRLILLPHHPVPTPRIYDEFGHLFVADTLLHFRLANPPHPLHQFFETFFILQQPTYSAIYPIGQGLLLALGRVLFGLPWAGVLLASAAFCSLCYWMLRGWTTPNWALAGGLLAVIEFGPLSPWMNTYWGGAFGAASGCLVFGALPRLVETKRLRYAVLLGSGLGFYLLIRPYGSVFLLLSVALFLAPLLRRRGEWRALLAAAAVAATPLVLALGITLLQNKSVTGQWTTLPYQVSQYQYGVPAVLTFQANAVPHNDLTPQQTLEYRTQLAFRGPGPETILSYFLRLEYRVRYYRFFFLPPLYLALLAFFAVVRSYRFLWVLLTLAAFALGINFFPAFQFHYLAAVTCLFLLVSVVGLERISRFSAEAARLILFLCVVHFAFWYTLHLFDTDDFSMAARRYETWHEINHPYPGRRALVQRQLAALPGKLLVFVRYWPGHIFQDEWVYNAADIDDARVVYARDLGEPENKKLRDYYPGRSVWLLEPDADPPRITPYHETPPPNLPPNSNTHPSPPQIKLEDVPPAG